MINVKSTMKVRDLMTGDAAICRLETDLAAAAVQMWQRDCGVLPVVDRAGKAIGMITDRDICMAVATQNRLASQITVGEIAARTAVVVCRADDDAESALKTMRKRQLRRLPVVDAENNLIGVVSISDFLRVKSKISRKKIYAALREISTFRPLQLREIANENPNENPNANANENPNENLSDNRDSEAPADED